MRLEQEQSFSLLFLLMFILCFIKEDSISVPFYTQSLCAIKIMLPHFVRC